VIGAGSIITKDVKDNALALSRVSQREFKKRKK
jgi:bifunctional N-acetylglucosamine-1-phosphate-uridyltransferase/glucosamine-1-phosphate-acetyltransferase GlmU-like protein